MKITFIIFILFSTQAFCEKDRIFVSPGIKFGYAFGEKGGFVFGFEISVADINSSNNTTTNYGAVISIETLKNERRLHVGIQTNFSGYRDDWSLLGLEVGPTYIFSKTKNNWGINITPYFGAFIIPYYRLLIVPGEYVQHEAGSFLKFHIPVKGDYIQH